MTSQQKACEQIVYAGQRLAGAADQWSAVDLVAIANCLSSLECSADVLSHALEILRESPPESISALRSNILELKENAARLERLTDSSASFLRCAPGLACDEPALYQAGGSVRITAPVAETRGMQA